MLIFIEHFHTLFADNNPSIFVCICECLQKTFNDLKWWVSLICFSLG